MKGTILLFALAWSILALPGAAAAAWPGGETAAACGIVAGSTIYVTTTADELDENGTCSLREAVIAANTDTSVDACPAGAGEDQIVLPEGTFLLSLYDFADPNDTPETWDLDVTDDVLLCGAGRTRTALDGAGETRIFDVIGADTSAKIMDLTIQNGFTIFDHEDEGGGIYNQGDLYLTRVNLVNNGTNVEGAGGAIFSDGNVTVIDGYFAENNAEAEGFGGGIYQRNGQLKLLNSVFYKNSGEGSAVSASSQVQIDHCVFQENFGYGSTVEGGTLTIRDSQFIDNHASMFGAGAISTWSPLLIDHTLFLRNASNSEYAGAVWFDADTRGVITHSTFLDNHSPMGGGAINTGGNLTVIASTFSGNVAGEQGGALYVEGGTLDLLNSTISGNSAGAGGGISVAGGLVSVLHTTLTLNEASLGGGLYVEAGQAHLRSSILAGNRAESAPECANPAGGLISEGYNLVGDATGCNWPRQNGDLLGVGGDPIDPLLGELADNGGLTQTHALLAGSPAIDAAINTGCPTTDQRGEIRPLDGDGDGIARCDIGAFELPAPPADPGQSVDPLAGWLRLYLPLLTD